MSAAIVTSPRLVCPTCMSVFLSYLPECPNDGGQLEVREKDPLVGRAFADRYVIEACIGEGGMGRVYRARHQRVSRRFAVKVLFGDFATDPAMRTRFAREAEAASRLDHPGLISVVDFGETSMGQLYLVMDYAEGQTLADLIANTGALDSERIATLTMQMAGGLAHAHELGLVHRDFKSDNVIVVAKPEGELARIVDFGLAIPQGPSQLSSRLTAHGLVMGTAEYMSPEQAVGEPLDRRTDLFSLGIVIYEMLAGVLPFDGNASEIIKKNLNETPPPVHQRVPGLRVDPELERIAFWLMRKRRSERPQSAHEIITALEARSASMQGGFPAYPPGTDVSSFAGAIPPGVVAPAPGLAPAPMPGPGPAGSPAMPWGNPGAGMARPPPYAMMGPPQGFLAGPRKWWLLLILAAIALGVTAAVLASGGSNQEQTAPPQTRSGATGGKPATSGGDQARPIEPQPGDRPVKVEPGTQPVTSQDSDRKDRPDSGTTKTEPTPDNGKSGGEDEGTDRPPRGQGDRYSGDAFDKLYKRVSPKVQSSQDRIDPDVFEDIESRFRSVHYGNIRFSDDTAAIRDAMKTLEKVERDLDRALARRRSNR